MVIIQFETGQKVNFDGNPTPQDVEEVANTLGINKSATSKPEGPKKNLLQKIRSGLDMVFGGGKIGEYIGSKIAKNSTAGKELAKQELSGIAPKGSVDGTFKGPSAGEIAGSALQSASLFLPVGRIAKGIGAGAKALGIGAKLATGIGKVGAGAATGEVMDIAGNLQDGKTGSEVLKPGVNTVIGGGLPPLSPIAKGAARIAGETLGATTGIGYGSLKAAGQAVRAGGEEATAFRSALRGKVLPEDIVDESKSALDAIIGKRNKEYTTQLQTLKTNKKLFDTKPVLEAFDNRLDEFGVFKNEKGNLDFSRSPGLGRYEKDLKQLSQTIKEWGSRPEDRTLVGIDKLKQTIDDFRIGSADSRKFDSFVTNLRNEAQKLIKNEPGYNELVKKFGESTGLIKEIQRGLSLGDKAQTDTAFRKLTTTLRTNNEFRKQLVDELNKETGGTLIPKIAGQQLSELLPRGLAKPLSVVGGGGAIASGMGILPLLKIAVFTSPRAVGEIINALGFTARQADKIVEFLVRQGVKFPGDFALDKLSS